MKTFLSIYGFLQTITFFWFIFLIMQSKCSAKYKKNTFKYWWDEKGLGWLLMGSFFALLLSISTYIVYSIFSVFTDL